MSSFFKGTDCFPTAVLLVSRVRGGKAAESSGCRGIGGALHSDELLDASGVFGE